MEENLGRVNPMHFNSGNRMAWLCERTVMASSLGRETEQKLASVSQHMEREVRVLKQHVDERFEQLAKQNDEIKTLLTAIRCSQPPPPEGSPSGLLDVDRAQLLVPTSTTTRPELNVSL